MIEIVKDGGITTAIGFRTSTAYGNIKESNKNKDDIGLLISDTPCNIAALFTKNIVKAAPIIYDTEVIKKNKKNIYGIIVNSGNANACTGEKGLENCKIITSNVEQYLKLPKNSILSASTGVIGSQLPKDKILSKTEELALTLSDDNGSSFAKSIMTTDTVSKEIALLIKTSNGSFVIGGCCKGAGMIAPSLATMLTFITTDANIHNDLLQKALEEASKDSFDCITVDGDMSTNDSVFVFANGMSGIKIDSSNFDLFLEGIKAISIKLAKMIAKDGEGATKLITINIKNAKTKEDAKACASKIANSPLVKTMFAGCDPNWGRLMASAGASGALFDPNKTDIFFNNIHYVQKGIIIDPKLEKEVYKIMKAKEYEITIDLHEGSNSISYYTCDFTVDYIKINADYRS